MNNIDSREVAFAYRMFRAVEAACEAHPKPGQLRSVHVPPEIAKIWLGERGLAEEFSYAVSELPGAGSPSAPEIMWLSFNLRVVPDDSFKETLTFRLHGW